MVKVKNEKKIIQNENNKPNYEITNNFVDDDVWPVIESFFDFYGLKQGQLSSFNNFIHHSLPQILEYIRVTEIEENSKKYIIKLGNYYLNPPSVTEIDESSKIIYPIECLQRNKTYCSELYIDIEVVLPTGNSNLYPGVYIGSIPVMVGSDLCNLKGLLNRPDELAKNGEDVYETGGYFIIAPKDGNQAQKKILVPQERADINKVYAFKNRKTKPKFPYYTEIRSAKNNYQSSSFIIGLINVGTSPIPKLILLIPSYFEIPVFLLLKAYGMTELEIIDLIFLGLEKFKNNMNIFSQKELEELNSIIIHNIEIVSNYDENKAKEYIQSLIKKNKDKSRKKNEDEPLPEDEAEELDDDVVEPDDKSIDLFLKNDILPHLNIPLYNDKDYKKYKCYFIGNMIKKLLYLKFNKKRIDDRDHYMNKRVMSTGLLFSQQFYSAMRKMMTEIINNTKSSIQKGNIVNIISWITNSLITNSMNGAVSGNNWVVGLANAKGVSQAFEVFNYACGLSNSRKITVPMASENSNVIEPHDLQECHHQIICPAETPEGKKCVDLDTEILVPKKNKISEKNKNRLPITKKIRDLKDGDFVYTYNIETSKLEITKIKDYFQIQKECYTLELENSEGNKKKLIGSYDHPVLCKRSWQTPVPQMMGEPPKIRRIITKSILFWKNLGEITAKFLDGQMPYEVVTYDGEKEISCRIISLVKNDNSRMVADFTTESDNHTFIANGIVTHNCGLVKNMAMTTIITNNSDPSHIIYVLEEEFKIKEKWVNSKNSLAWVPIYLNGILLGLTDDPISLYERIRLLKRESPEISVGYFPESQYNYFPEILIYTDAGRLCRPLLKVNSSKLLLEKNKIKNFKNLLEKGWVELIDKSEEEYLNVAYYPTKLNEYMDAKDITHCELHPSLMYGVGASNIPFSSHNTAPRVTYQASMSKQAIGTPFLNYRNVFTGNFYTMGYPQKPLALNRISIIMKTDIMSSGQNAIVAVMPRPFNEEDSIEINQSSIDREFMVVYKWICYYSDIKKNDEIFGRVDPEKCSIKSLNGIKVSGFDNITEEGYPKPGSKLKKGDIVIGKIVKNYNTGDPKFKPFKSASLIYDHPLPATVDKVQLGATAEGYPYIRVMVAQRRIMEHGDKGAFCLTPDHEILTSNRGWIEIQDVKKDDFVAILDPQGNNIKYEQPQNIISYHYEGKMYELKSQQVDLITTPDHRMWVQTPNNENFEFMFAKDCFGKELKYKNTTSNLFDEKYIQLTEKTEKWVDYKGMVWCLTVSTGVFLVRKNGKPVFTGNCHAQKGTIGMKYRQEDFPFSKSGMVPDVILNSLALPSRMTIAMLIEVLCGKIVSSKSILNKVEINSYLNGNFKKIFKNLNGRNKDLIDATPFRDFDEEEIFKEMKNYDYNAYGDEMLFDGITGQPLRSLIFFGPASYQRLKHMSGDKLHCRSTGPITQITRQPTEGKSADGGLRYGVMEVDCTIANSCAYMVKDRTCEQSDDFRLLVCKRCGLNINSIPDILNKENKRENNSDQSTDHPDLCRVCGFNEFSFIQIPYGAQLVNQELAQLNIITRINTTPYS